MHRRTFQCPSVLIESGTPPAPKTAFNVYLFQETGGHKRLLFGFLHFDMIHFDLPSLPVLVQLLDDLPVQLLGRGE